MEILVATIIMTLVVGGALVAYIMSQTAWREGGAQIALQRRGSITMERMVRGVRLGGETRKNGIREASVVNIPDRSTIRFTSGIDGRQRCFFLQGDEIFYDPDPSTAGDEVSIAGNVSRLDFEMVSSRRVRIDMTLQRRVFRRMIAVNVTTDCTLRN